MVDRSRAHAAHLRCRCGGTRLYEHWDIIDEAARPDLVEALRSAELTRLTCHACGRIHYDAEPVGVLRARASSRIVLTFTGRELGEDEAPTVGGEPVPWIAAPFEAAPLILPRDLDADVADVPRARAEVTALAGPSAGLSYQEWLRTLVVTHDAYDVVGVGAELLDLPRDQLEAYVAARRDVLSEGFQASARRIAEVFPEHRATTLAVAAVFDAVRQRAPDPFRVLDEYIARFGAQLEALAPDVERIAAAFNARRFDEVIAQAPAVIEQARELGGVAVVGFVSHMFAGALLEEAGPGYDEQIEQAIAALQDAISFSPDDEARAEYTLQLGVAYVFRVRGDRRRNISEALGLLEEALGSLPAEAHGKAAWVQTTLAQALMAADGDDPVRDLTAAKALCERALQWRTPARDSEGWAFTMLALARVQERLAALGRARSRDARRIYMKLVQERDRLEPAARVSATLQLARHVRLHSVGVGQTRRLREARDRLAVELEQPDAVRRTVRGEALGELGLCELELGDRKRAIELLQDALGDLRPEIAPLECADVAWACASLLSDDGRWPEAAAAWTDGVTAADLMFYGRATPGDRAGASRARGNLSRWAAFAVAKVGDLEHAAVILEDGRTRELRLRLGADDEELERLQATAPQLHTDYVAALADLARSELLEDRDAAAARHQQVLDRVRALDGFERFAGPLSWLALEGRLSPDEPLVYVNPTPWGTMLLVLAGGHAPRVRFLELSSTEIAHGMIFGIDTSGRQLAPPFALSAAGNGLHLEEALAFSLDAFAAPVAEAITEDLAALGVGKVALVISGTLAQLPVQVRFPDHLEVVHAPSATLHAAARAKETAHRALARNSVLVALGDPRDGDDALPAARAEISEIASRFDDTRVALGTAASSAFLRDHARDATYLHLACHAGGSLFGYRDAHLKLADEDLPLTELARVGPLTCRIAVASACQTAMPDAELADEGLSIGAVLLAAGSAAAIASLWPVDDVATAMLMVRFYDELLDEDAPSPVMALARAQRWLRELPRAEAEAFIDAHPALRAEAGRRRGAGTAVLPDGDPPFSPAPFWAGFIALGA